MLSDATAKLSDLVAQAHRHRRAARDYRLSAEELSLPGYLTMAGHHDALFELVCDQIRLHCADFGLALPDWLTGRKRD